MTRKKNGGPARDFATFEHLVRKEHGGTLDDCVLAHSKCNLKANIRWQAEEKKKRKAGEAALSRDSTSVPVEMDTAVAGHKCLMWAGANPAERCRNAPAVEAKPVLYLSADESPNATAATSI